MQAPLSKRVTKNDLKPQAMWRAVFAALPEDSRAAWERNQEALSFAQSLVSYFTPILPSPLRPEVPLAVECLAAVSSTSCAAARIEDLADLALGPASGILYWQVYVNVKKNLVAWDPISGPLAAFLAGKGTRVLLARQPPIQGPLADPDSLRFLLRHQLLKVPA